MRVFVEGSGWGKVVDQAYDPNSGRYGVAVKLESGKLDLVDPSLVHHRLMNPGPGSRGFAVGEVELSQPGKPNVVAMRFNKVSKSKQLADLLRVPVSWQPKHDQGFVADLPGGPVPLGYSVVEALESARSRGLLDLDDQEIQDFAELAELKKWGLVDPGPVVNPAPAAAAPAPAPAARFAPLGLRPGMQVQSVLVPSSWSKAQAKQWLEAHGFEALEADPGVTVNRYRQAAPGQFEPGSFSTVPFGQSGVQAVVGVPKRVNPWGMDDQGRKVFYVRQAGPSKSKLLSQGSGDQVQYFWPGDPASPDPAKGGFFLGDQFLGRSYGEAHKILLGLPVREIQQSTITGDLGRVARLQLENGDRLLDRVLNRADLSAFERSLSELDRQVVESEAKRIGYRSIQDLGSDLWAWSDQVKSEFARFPNPPLDVQVVGPGGSFPVVVDSRSGEVLQSPSFQGLQGLTVSPFMASEQENKEGLDRFDRSDFSSAQEAWDQFYHRSPSNIRLLESEDYDVFLQDQIGEWLFGPGNWRAKRIKRVEDAVKAIVNRLGVRRWRDFPIDRLKEIPGLEGLILPGSQKEEGGLLDPELELGVTRRDLVEGLGELQAITQDHFGLLRSAFSLFEWYRDRLRPAVAQAVSASLKSATDSDQPFTVSNYQDLLAIFQTEIDRQDQPVESEDEGLPF